MRITEVDQPWEKARELFLRYFITANDDFTISNDGIITCNTSCRAASTLTNKYDITTLPVKFSVINGTFTISETYLTTLEGCPQETTNSFLCNHTNITSLVGGPRIVKGNYEIINCPIESLDGLPDEVWGEFSITPTSTPLPLLRFLSIKKLKSLKFNPLIEDKDEIMLNILNKYIGNPSKGNILACAAELTKAGFKDYARR